ncbi:cornifelin isoform X2 [Pseudophryne corroboree]|uniref:cornifelin isoform X2 n=1 Tax=Pseudophryne corroboree TaxID=495146 RepID=UPI003081CD9B
MLMGADDQRKMQVPVFQAPPAAVPMQVPVAVPMQDPVAVPTQVPVKSPAVPVVTQPICQPQVVVNVQGSTNTMGMPMSFGPITWRTGLFQCFEDIPICLLGCFCPIFLPCYLSSLFGEVCFFGMLPGAMFALRTGVRERYRIPGDLLNDYCAVCCCSACSLCQLARELKGRDRQRHVTTQQLPHQLFNF